MIWTLNRGFEAERMPSQRGKVYCTEWCWYIGRLAREGTGARQTQLQDWGSASGPVPGLALPISRGCSTRARTSLFFISFPTSPLHGEVQHDGQTWVQARFPTSLYHTALAPDSQPAVSKTRPRSKRPLLLVVWTGLSIPRQRRLTDA